MGLPNLHTVYPQTENPSKGICPPRLRGDLIALSPGPLRCTPQVDCLSGEGLIYSIAMRNESGSTERKRNIWAPWRMEYINGLHENQDEGCFLCRYRDEEDQDKKNLVLWRGKQSFVVLNRFPYTGGHSLIAPYDHVADLEDLEDPAMLEMMHLIRDVKHLLTAGIHPEGFNVGMNIGRCAGAGLPGHLHIHVVPRWSGDTNFMAVLGEVHTVPQALADLHARLIAASAELGLPKLASQ